MNIRTKKTTVLFKRPVAWLMSALLASTSVVPVFAEDYSDEDAWYETCTQVQTTEEGVKACQGFQAYQDEKREKLNADIAKLNESIAALSEDSSQIEALAKEQKELSDSLQAQIAAKEAAVAATEASISDTTTAIAEKQAEIDLWDDQIKERMRSEQGRTATNSLVDLIMGSTSLADMLRRVTGLQRITASDQDQIDELNQRKKELEQTISGLTDLIAQNKVQIEELEEQKAIAQEMQANYETLVADYEEKIAEIQAQKRSVEVDRDAVKEFTINVDLTKAFYDSIPSNKDMINPVPNARVSAGTWAYNGGGLHLGMDFAAAIGSDLIAPANGLILYATNTEPSNSGYLGNWSGLPMGSGNYIQMLCEVDGTLYSVSFAHLSNEFNVKAGDIVSQGQVIAKTGNAGNSTGPHTHIEVYNLGDMTMQQAVEAFKANNDFTFGSGWGSAQKACEAGNAAPCRERPEIFFAQS